MIKLVYSNKTERLLVQLAQNILEWREKEGHLLEPIELVVPNRNMETWLSLGLAQLTGIAANLRFNWLNRFIGELISKVCPGEIELADLDIVEAAVLAVLMNEQLLKTPELQPINIYLHNTGTQSADLRRYGFDACLAADGIELRRVQLAARMAFLFQEYSFSRPEMVAAWRGDGNWPADAFGRQLADPVAVDPAVAPTVVWQRALWQAVFGKGGVLEQHPPRKGGRWVTMDLLPFEACLFDNLKKTKLPPVHIFGISYMAWIFQHFFARLGKIMDLHFYTLNPCAEFWEDVDTLRGYSYRLDQEIERRKQLARKDKKDAFQDPFGLFAKDNPALLYWGRPGGEYMRLLGELTECDFTDAFENPFDGQGGLLHRLQLDILTRTPEQDIGQSLGKQAVGIGKIDETIKLVAAPSVRREVEWVADEIWRLMRQDEGAPNETPLRFSDIAIIVNSTERDKYLPIIEAVFAAGHGLPCSISDLPGSSGSRMVEATKLLLKFPFGHFSRAEMLTLMGHPAVIGNFDDLTFDDLAAVTEKLGIIFGADRQDHAGTYIKEDIYNWDQGIRRLVLGVFMTGEKSGDQRIFEVDDRKWLVEEVLNSEIAVAARFGLLARSLLADARFVRQHRMTLTEWVKFYFTQMETYFHIEKGADENDLLMLRNALRKLEKMDLGHKVGGRAAAEIAIRALDSLTGEQGQYLTEGVAVSTFLPMRAIPFRIVFLLGLGEGLFPASSQRDALDLRSVQRREGDVDPSERDRYMFLETLLCTRERLYLSYVSRNEHTGDILQPSAVVQELLHILKLGYLKSGDTEKLIIKPPLQLRRYDEDIENCHTFFDEAWMEAHIQKMAQEWHAHIPWEGKDMSRDCFAQMRHFLSPEQQAALFKMLGLPGEPPAAAIAMAAAKFAPYGEGGMLGAPLSLSLSVLRRFLECPMQGWASALLGLTEVEEDLADREEEDFEINRLVEIGLLNDVFFQVVANKNNVNVEKYYKERMLRLQLAGKIPIGILGEVIQRRHLSIIAGWLSLLKELKEKGFISNGAGFDLHQVQLGYSTRKSIPGDIVDPLLLEIPLNNPQGLKRIVPVRINGLSEGLSPNRMVSVSVQSRKPPASGNKRDLTSNFRYFLRGAVAQAALAAINVAGDGEQQVVILFADGTNNPRGLRFRLQPFDATEARSWLTAIATDLLAGPHAYLLPCEAVFNEYYFQEEEPSVNGAALSALIANMAEDEWERFSSLWGPVPSPRQYDPPSADEAKQMVIRRFGPLFDRILNWEVL